MVAWGVAEEARRWEHDRTARSWASTSVRTGVKGAPVDLTTGELVADRVKIKTPKPATPDAVADVVEEIAGGFADSVGDSPIGIAMAVCQRGVARSAANIDPAWVDTDVDALFTERLQGVRSTS